MTEIEEKLNKPSKELLITIPEKVELSKEQTTLNIEIEYEYAQ